MTNATREALVQVDRILHEAGWDRNEADLPELTDEAVDAVRRAYSEAFHSSDFEILETMLGNSLSLQEASSALGIPREEVTRRLRQALHRVHCFVATSEAQGFFSTPHR